MHIYGNYQNHMCWLIFYINLDNLIKDSNEMGCQSEHACRHGLFWYCFFLFPRLCSLNCKQFISNKSCIALLSARKYTDFP